MDSSELIQDAIRLLYIIDTYTNSDNMDSKGNWLKANSLYVIAHLGVHSGAFEDYDVTPSLLPFRGIKMFAMLSQEAIEDVNTFLAEGWVEKLLLNSWFYATTTGYRITETGHRVVQERITDEDKRAIDPLIFCSDCKASMDFAVSLKPEPAVRLVMNRVCRCKTAGRHSHDDYWIESCTEGVIPIKDFFSIGAVEYSASSFYL